MSSFWTGLFDHLRRCGRNATIFFFALAGFFSLLILVAIINASGFFPSMVPVLPGIGLLGAAWGCAAVRRARVRRRERLQYPPLSRDELRAARSKLMRDRKPKNL